LQTGQCGTVSDESAVADNLKPLTSNIAAPAA